MRLELEKRAEHSTAMALLSPVIALALTLVSGAILFAALGENPAEALYVFFIEPLTASWSLQELVVKATPLILIGVGLAVCYLSNTWNIGGEGQFTAGALAGSVLPILFPDFQTPLTLPLMLLMGIAGGMAWAAIPAFLKVRFGTNEILTSLMLVYISLLLLDWLVRGPWRDPDGYNFPESRIFSDAASLPALADGRMHVGAIFSQNKMVWFAFLLSGGLAGLAGISEVSGSINQLTPVISPGYGFTAIIVAFLGRLNPVGILFSGLLLALSYLGGEAAQVALGISDKTTRVFQGMLLFYVLACDTLILYRIRLGGPAATGKGA